MKGPSLIGQLVADARLSKSDAERLAMLAALAEGGRSIEAAARGAGMSVDRARVFAQRFGISFHSGGPA